MCILESIDKRGGGGGEKKNRKKKNKSEEEKEEEISKGSGVRKRRISGNLTVTL